MYSWYIENIDEVRRALDQAALAIGHGTVMGVRLGVKEGAEEALSTRHWKNRTGQTAKMTRGYMTEHVDDGSARGVIECAVPHASFLEEGTPPHDIWPRQWGGGQRQPGQKRRNKDDVGTNRVALRWYSAGGQPVFARMVHHPGTKPDGFMGRAYVKCERVCIREVEIGVAKAQHILDS